MTHAIPARDGHFVLESGLHTDRWYDLDALFNDPRAIEPAIERLAALLAPHRPTAICGPMVGGALLAHTIAARMGSRFLYTQRGPDEANGGLFKARYALPAGQHGLSLGQRVAIVDDMISAGSSTRATFASLCERGATVVAIGTLHLSGDTALQHFDALGIPLEAVERRPFRLWKPTACPLCAQGLGFVEP